MLSLKQMHTLILLSRRNYTNPELYELMKDVVDKNYMKVILSTIKIQGWIKSEGRYNPIYSITDKGRNELKETIEYTKKLITLHEKD